MESSFRIMRISEAIKKLQAGEVVVFPTETVYGLGALANNQKAVKRIFQIKGRPAKNPLILHIGKKSDLKNLVKKIPRKAILLIKHFWPGPLTLCFEKSSAVSDLVTAGLSTVCIRMPDHPIAKKLLLGVGEPIAAPSANISGKPSTTTFQDALKQLKRKGVFFLKGAKTQYGLESTILDVRSTRLKLLRYGALSKEAIERLLKEKIVDRISSKQVLSPGQMLVHYQPKGNMIVLFGSRSKRRKALKKKKSNSFALGYIGEKPACFTSRCFQLAVKENDLFTYTRNLYAFLNWCDARKAKEIILELPLIRHPLLDALLDRLKKASRGNIIQIQ